jgi:hypothetical protein
MSDPYVENDLRMWSDDVGALTPETARATLRRAADEIERMRENDESLRDELDLVLEENRRLRAELTGRALEADDE